MELDEKNHAMTKYSYDIKRNLIIETFMQDISIEDIVQLKKKEIANGHYQKGVKILIDIRFANINNEDLFENSFLNNLSKVYFNQQAILVVGSIVQLFSPIGLRLRDEFKNKIKAFTKFNDAIEWIDTN